MSERLSKRARSQFGGFTHDRVPLEEDFDTIKARTEGKSSTTYLPVHAGKSLWNSPWTTGSSWEPEENYEFSLDPDHVQYKAVVDAELADMLEELPMKKKKKRSQASVCTLPLKYSVF